MDAARPTRPALSLVIPAFNEAAGVRRAVIAADEVLSTHFPDHEVIVVDDGSSDGTADEVQAAGLLSVRLVRHAHNRGYGAALRTGFEAARCPLVAFTDADEQFDLADLATLADLTGAAPIAVGYRAPREDPALRKLLARGYNLLTRTLLGTRVRDCDCALKVFRREVVAGLLPRSRGFFVNAEMLTYARQQDLAVAEAPVSHRRRAAGNSTVGWRDVPRTARALLAFWWSDVAFGPRPRRHAAVRHVIAARVRREPLGLWPARPRASESPRPVAPPAPVKVPA